MATILEVIFAKNNNSKRNEFSAFCQLYILGLAITKGRKSFQINIRIMMDENNTQIPAKFVEEGKTMAIVAYITIFGLIIAFFINNDKKNPFTAFHIRQSLGLGLIGITLSIASYVPFLGWIISMLGSVVLIILWAMGLIGAVNGERKPAPFIGEKFQEWFKNI